MNEKVAALVSAINDLQAELPVINISHTHHLTDSDETHIMVLHPYELAPIPGEAVVKDGGETNRLRFRVSKFFGGVEFFCLTNEVSK